MLRIVDSQINLWEAKTRICHLTTSEKLLFSENIVGNAAKGQHLQCQLC